MRSSKSLEMGLSERLSGTAQKLTRASSRIQMGQLKKPNGPRTAEGQHPKNRMLHLNGS